MNKRKRIEPVKGIMVPTIMLSVIFGLLLVIFGLLLAVVIALFITA